MVFVTQELRAPRGTFQEKPLLLALLVTLSLSALFTSFPQLDIAVSRLFYVEGEGFPAAKIDALNTFRAFGQYFPLTLTIVLVFGLVLKLIYPSRPSLFPPRFTLYFASLFLTGPALASSQHELEQLVKQRMDQIRRSAPECDKNSYLIDGVGDCRGPWKVCDVTKPFTFAACGGSMTHTPSSARGGSFTFNHSGVRGNGSYTLTGDKNRMSATYQGTVCLPTGACIQQPPGKAVWTQIDDCDG